MRRVASASSLKSHKLKLDVSFGSKTKGLFDSKIDGGLQDQYTKRKAMSVDEFWPESKESITTPPATEASNLAGPINEISEPWGFQHNIHVDVDGTDFVGLPPEWEDVLRISGITNEEARKHPEAIKKILEARWQDERFKSFNRTGRLAVNNNSQDNIPEHTPPLDPPTSYSDLEMSKSTVSPISFSLGGTGSASSQTSKRSSRRSNSTSSLSKGTYRRLRSRSQVEFRSSWGGQSCIASTPTTSAETPAFPPMMELVDRQKATGELNDDGSQLSKSSNDVVDNVQVKDVEDNNFKPATGVNAENLPEEIRELAPLLEPGDPSLEYTNMVQIAEGQLNAEIFAAEQVSTQRVVAVKVLPIQQNTNIPEDALRIKSIKNEISLTRQLHAPNVVQVIACYYQIDRLWIIMELMEISLADIIIARPHGINMSELFMARVTHEMVQTLQYIHNLDIIHRDIRSDNILINSSGEIKLYDFAHAVQLTEDAPYRRSIIGTPYWMAPEVTRSQSYRKNVDIWSLGVVISEMVDGEPPYVDYPALKALYLISRYGIPIPANIEKYSNDMKDFYTSCTIMDVSQRPSAEQLVSHPWLEKLAPISEVLDVLDLVRKLEASQEGHDDDVGHDAANETIIENAEEVDSDTHINKNENPADSNSDNEEFMEAKTTLDSTAETVESNVNAEPVVTSDIRFNSHTDIVNDIKETPTADTGNDIKDSSTAHTVNDIKDTSTADIVSDIKDTSTVDTVNDAKDTSTSDTDNDIKDTSTADIVSDIKDTSTTDTVNDAKDTSTTDTVNDAKNTSTTDTVNDAKVTSTTDTVNDVKESVTSDVQVKAPHDTIADASADTSNSLLPTVSTSDTATNATSNSIASIASGGVSKVDKATNIPVLTNAIEPVVTSTVEAVTATVIELADDVDNINPSDNVDTTNHAVVVSTVNSADTVADTISTADPNDTTITTDYVDNVANSVPVDTVTKTNPTDTISTTNTADIIIDNVAADKPVSETVELKLNEPPNPIVNINTAIADVTTVITNIADSNSFISSASTSNVISGQKNILPRLQIVVPTNLTVKPQSGNSVMTSPCLSGLFPSPVPSEDSSFRSIDRRPHSANSVIASPCLPNLFSSPVPSEKRTPSWSSNDNRFMQTTSAMHQGLSDDQNEFDEVDDDVDFYVNSFM